MKVDPWPHPDARGSHAAGGTTGRRPVTERVKGILMERHGIGEQAAFEMLRDQARRTQRKLVDIADAVVTGHPMLPAQRGTDAESTSRCLPL
jgi:hypothetical protein